MKKRKVFVQMLMLLLFLFLMNILGFLLSILFHGWITFVTIVVLSYFECVINIYLVCNKEFCWKFVLLYFLLYFCFFFCRVCFGVLVVVFVAFVFSTLTLIFGSKDRNYLIGFCTVSFGCMTLDICVSIIQVSILLRMLAVENSSDEKDSVEDVSSLKYKKQINLVREDNSEGISTGSKLNKHTFSSPLTHSSTLEIGRAHV
jgi:hypothetical protein